MSNRPRLCVCLSAFLLASSFLPAGARGAEDPVPLRVEQAVEMGLKYSRSLQASSERVEGAEAKARESDTYRWPTLTFSGAYSRLSKIAPFTIELPPELGLGNFVINPGLPNIYGLQLSVQQPLFTGFLLSGVSESTRLQAQASREEFRRDESEVALSVRSAYWTVYKAKDLKRLVDENVALVEAHLKDVRNFFDQGLASQNDVLKVQVQLSSVQLMRVQAANGVTLAAMALNSLIGLPINSEITILSSVAEPAAARTPIDALVARALERRPELKAQNLQIKAAEAGIKIANSYRYPQVYLLGNFYSARPNERIMPIVDRFRETWDVSLAVSFDVWNWNRAGHQARQARALAAQAEHGASQLKDGIILEVSQNYYALEQQALAVKLAADTVAQAEENYRVTGNRFKAGLALNSDLLDAEVSLLQAKINYSQALVDGEMLRARLAKSVGSEGGES